MHSRCVSQECLCYVMLCYDYGPWSEDPSWRLFNGPKPVRVDTHCIASSLQAPSQNGKVHYYKQTFHRLKFLKTIWKYIIHQYKKLFCLRSTPIWTTPIWTTPNWTTPIWTYPNWTGTTPNWTTPNWTNPNWTNPNWTTPIWTEGSIGLPPIGLPPIGLPPIGLPPFGLTPNWTKLGIFQMGVDLDQLLKVG